MEVLITFISAVCAAIIGLIVLRRHGGSWTNKIFGIFSFSIASWAVVNYLSLVSTDKSDILFWMRSVMAIAVIQSVSFLLFIHTFPKKKITVKRNIFILFSITVLAAIFISYSPYLFQDVIIENGRRTPTVAPGMLLFLVTAVGSLLLGFILLIQRLRHEHGVVQSQFRYIFIGTLIMFACIIFFNLVLVLIFKQSSFVNYGPFFVLPFIASTMYAIVRYRFLDIRIVIRKAFVFFGTASFAFTTFYLTYWLEINFFGTIFGPASYSLGILNSVIFVVAFYYLRDWLTAFSNKYFFAGLYNTQQTIVKLTQELNVVTDLDGITESLVSTIKETMALDRTGVFFLERGAKGKVRYRVAKVIGFSDKVSDNDLIYDGFLTAYLERTREPLVRDELEIISQSSSAEDAQELIRLSEFMQKTEAALYLPLLSSTALVGVIVLGDKVSRDAYTKDDIELLTTLSYQAGTALQNALLYREVQDFNKKLQKKVDAATEELRQANEDLIKLDKAKTEFLSIASHQLLTPLTPIEGYGEMLLDGTYGKLSKEQSEVVNMMKISAVRLVRLVDDLLNVSRIEGGRLHYEMSDQRLEDILTPLVEDMQIKAKKINVKLVYKPPVKPTTKLHIDEDKMRNVMMNLIDNSLKYSPGGVSTVALEEKDGKILFSVKDNGIGISKEDLERLFNKFVRSERAVTVHTEGTGLGLYVVRQFIEGMGGKVWGESAGEDKGSQFYVQMPVKK